MKIEIPQIEDLLETAKRQMKSALKYQYATVQLDGITLSEIIAEQISTQLGDRLHCKGAIRGNYLMLYISKKKDLLISPSLSAASSE